ncbi:MAG TPA: DedA family protein [Vicinamibacterales bacterium]|nr:DedA family protein [Vicinamibacterales bacterium]
MPAWILDLFARYGYAAVFVGVFLENTGLPVPGETMLLAGAALAQFGRLSLAWVIVCAIAGATLGDNLGFFIGRRGGRRLAERFIPSARLRDFDRYFEQHGPKTVFIARFITGLRVVGALLAGGSGMRWRTFLVYNAAGAVVWSTTFGVVGYFLGKSWDVLERFVGSVGVAGLIAGIGLTIIWFLRGRRRESP